ncbi:Glucan endo-1,3-beta-glucosidase 1 [Mucuna pruriens]|uniref:Glucan endo-1,3-beta-glucosidase 1 n=1 Tax=Mucuna pruriens TaxID=157652 RepID=A0A371IAP5_MUCPR|nr:Glucan endo-1,3-beta-glucosidase 1 [Mucuna pruriens]
MAKEVSLCLLFLSFLIISSSGSLVGFSYRERGETSTSARTISFLHQNKVPSSQIRIFVTDHRILNTLGNSNVPTDVYLNKSEVENFITSKPSALKARVLNFLPHLNIKSIIASCGSECLAQNEMPLFLHALKSIGSVLSELRIGREVKVSVAFPLSFLEKLNASHENNIRRVLSFTKEMKSFVMVEDSIDGELSMGGHLVHAIIERATLAASIIPCKDVPIVLTIKSTVIPNSMELAQFSERVSKYLESKTHIAKRIAALYAELHTREDFARRSLDDTTNPTNTVFPTNPASSTPIITPPDTPTIITVPATNPVTISPSNPAAMPVTVPSTTPVPIPPTNPANSPVPVSNPATTTPVVTPPVTSNPPPSASVPVTNPQPQPPPANTNLPAIQGQSWCVAKQGTPEASLQAALDYACGMGGADCSQIQQGGNCYSPVTLQNHASFAFNSYYQKNPAPTSCDFGGTASLVNTNPSSGSCIFPSSSSSSSTTPKSSSPTPPTQSTPTTLAPPSPVTPASSIPTAPPTTSSSSGTGPFGYGTPPSVLNSSNPASGTMPAFGSDSPPVVNTTSASHSVGLRPFVGCILLMVSFVTTRLIV